MRRTIRGAAAVAALCTGALAFSSVAIAAPDSSGKIADATRIAGRDRVQTSLEALNNTVTGDFHLLVVGYNGVVDALSLAPLANALDDQTAVVYASPNGLDARVVKVLTDKAANLKDVVISGGFGAVPANVEAQLEKIKKNVEVTRLNGRDRYETAYLTGALVLAKDSVAPALRNAAAAATVNAKLAEARAAFRKAKAANDAAIADAVAKEKAYAEAVDAFAKKLATVVSDADVANSNKEVQDGLTAGDLLENTQKWVKFTKAKKYVDVLVNAAGVKKDTPVAELKAKAEEAKDEAVLDAIKVLNGDTTVDPNADATELGSIDADKVSEVVAKYEAKEKELKDAITKAASDLGKLIKKAQDNEAAAAQLKDPNSELSKLNNAQLAAKAAKDAADKALVKTNTDLSEKTTAFEEAAEAAFDAEVNDYAKALDAAVAEAYKGNTKSVFLSTGRDFADALTAGPAAVSKDGIVLLTNGKQINANVKAVADASKKTVYTIGGPAAAAYPNSDKVIGNDRYDTSAKVAAKFFDTTAPGVYALASGQVGADAVIAGVYQVEKGYQAVLLTTKDVLPGSVANFIAYGNFTANQKVVERFIVFGGDGVVSDAVVAAAHAKAVK